MSGNGEKEAKKSKTSIFLDATKRKPDKRLVWALWEPRKPDETFKIHVCNYFEFAMLNDELVWRFPPRTSRRTKVLSPHRADTLEIFSDSIFFGDFHGGK